MTLDGLHDGDSGDHDRDDHSWARQSTTSRCTDDDAEAEAASDTPGRRKPPSDQPEPRRAGDLMSQLMDDDGFGHARRKTPSGQVRQETSRDDDAPPAGTEGVRFPAGSYVQIES